MTPITPNNAFRRKFFVFSCFLYMVIGAASIAAGVITLTGPGGVSGRHGFAPPPAILLIAAVLIGFGLLRIGNAAYQLYRVYRRPR